MASDQDAARLHALEEKADCTREALEQALLSLQAPEDHHGATQLALCWAGACDAAHRWVEYVLGFRRRDPTFAFRFFAETCLELYRGLTGVHTRVLRHLAHHADVVALSQINTTFLSPLQQAVAEGAPDLLPQLQAAAQAGDFPVTEAARHGLPGRPTRTVQRLHFEDLDGHNFERLVFAYLLAAGEWAPEWYGEVGSDGGRDIRGHAVRRRSRRLIVQCANRGKLTPTKLKRDLNEAIKADGVPHTFLVVCRTVSPKTRDQVTKHAKSMGVTVCVIRSAQEFEEDVRLVAPALLRRFFDGVTFPDDPRSLAEFARECAAKDGPAGKAPKAKVRKRLARA